MSRLAPWQAEEALVAACNAAAVTFSRVDLTADGKRSSIRLAMEHGMQTKRKPKGGAPDAAKISMPDENCIARLAIHGHI